MPDAIESDALLVQPPVKRQRVLENWSERLKWFAGEFAVVVAGILVALALQAWWQTRQDAAQGAEYQQQVLSDLRITERTLRRSIALDSAHRAATTRLSSSLYVSGTLTRDAALSWLKWRPGWFADARPILGNVNSLIQTGDIRLVQDPKTRSMIIAYASIMMASGQNRDDQSARMYRGNDLELARLDAAGVPLFSGPLSDEGTYDLTRQKEYVSRYVAAWPRLRSDPEFRTAQLWRLLAYTNIEDYNKEMLAVTTKLRARLEWHGD